MLILMLPLVSSYTEVQYSLDNLNWTHYSYTNDNALTIEVLNNGIDSDTFYYLRFKNVFDSGESDWEYVNIKTKGSEEVLSVSFTAMIGLGMLLLVGFLFLAIFIFNGNSVFGVVSAICFVINGLILIVSGIDGIDSSFTIGFGVVIILVGAFIALISFKGD